MRRPPRPSARRQGIPTYKFDVADYGQCEAAAKKIAAELGPIDVLVNNAGITRDGTMHKMTPQQWAEVINTNLTSCFNLSRCVIDGMRERSFGRIVNIGSINGQAGQYGQVNYAAAKSGIHGFTKALAQEGAGKGITVNAIAPGYIDTEMVRAVPRKVLEEDRRPHPSRPPRQGRGDRPRRAVPGRRRRRLHHRLDALHQRRAAYVLCRRRFSRRRPPVGTVPPGEGPTLQNFAIQSYCILRKTSQARVCVTRCQRRHR